MNEVNKTLYIPLYGKSYVSEKGIILNDKKAEEIWRKEKFPLKGKSKSKWLAYYMAMRARVFDDYLKSELEGDDVVIHLGCGMDSRIERVKLFGVKWYDVDFPDVIKERKRYYCETDNYKMVASNINDSSLWSKIPSGENAVILLEGVSMYLKEGEIKNLFSNIEAKFKNIKILADFYTSFAAKASKYKNPINEVGVTEVYGTDDPSVFERERIKFFKEHSLTPEHLINELKGMEKVIFKALYAGKISQKLYKLYEYKSSN